MIFAENTNGNNGLKIGPDGRLYGCQSKANRVVAYDVKTAKETVLAEGIHDCNDPLINHNGDIYVTEPPMSQVWHISPTGDKKIVIEKKAGIQFPNGIGFTPDQSQLVIDDTRGVNFSICQVNPDGSVSHGAPYFSAQLLPMEHDSGADGLCFDSQGRLYVTTHLGLQIFDQAGRVIGIINKIGGCEGQEIIGSANVTFGGKDLTDLYITCGPNVYRRKVKVKGVLGFESPSKPEKPRL